MSNTDTVLKDGTDGLVTAELRQEIFKLAKDLFWRVDGNQRLWSGEEREVYGLQAAMQIARSQAESEIRKVRKDADELLAAERAEHDNTITTLTSLIADNAAKDARIKELETELTQTVLKKKNNADLFWKAREKFNNRIKSLEAKLAAAQKALESAAKDFDVLFCTPRVTETKSTDDQFDLVIAMAGRFGTDAQQKLRAALGGKS